MNNVTTSKEWNVFEKTGTYKAEKSYRGIQVIKTWLPSNYYGTVVHSAEMPNGKTFYSASWDNLKKQIKKNL